MSFPPAINNAWALAFNVIIFLLTFIRTQTLSRQAKAVGIEASLYTLLLRDGEFLPVISIK